MVQQILFNWRFNWRFNWQLKLIDTGATDPNNNNQREAKENILFTSNTAPNVIIEKVKLSRTAFPNLWVATRKWVASRWVAKTGKKNKKLNIVSRTRRAFSDFQGFLSFPAWYGVSQYSISRLWVIIFLCFAKNKLKKFSCIGVLAFYLHLYIVFYVVLFCVYRVYVSAWPLYPFTFNWSSESSFVQYLPCFFECEEWIN